MLINILFTLLVIVCGWLLHLLKTECIDKETFASKLLFYITLPPMYLYTVYLMVDNWIIYTILVEG